jgi:hypothetical protein
MEIAVVALVWRGLLRGVIAVERSGGPGRRRSRQFPVETVPTTTLCFRSP